MPSSQHRGKKKRINNVYCYYFFFILQIILQHNYYTSNQPVGFNNQHNYSNNQPNYVYNTNIATHEHTQSYIPPEFKISWVVTLPDGTRLTMNNVTIRKLDDEYASMKSYLLHKVRYYK